MEDALLFTEDFCRISDVRYLLNILNGRMRFVFLGILVYLVYRLSVCVSKCVCM